MPMVKKSITVTAAQADWLAEQIDAGRYASGSELIREALREKQQRTAEIDAIRVALEEGEASGRSDRTLADIREAVLARRG